MASSFIRANGLIRSFLNLTVSETDQRFSDTVRLTEIFDYMLLPTADWK